jgi:hypothetical protein
MIATLALCFALDVPPVDPAAPAAEAAPATAASTPSTATPAPAPAPSTWQRDIGVGLVASGATVAVVGTASFTLIDSLTTPDRRGQEPSAAATQFATIAGFTSAALTSVSAVVIVVGATLLVTD